jgi:hypothetical protein
MSPAHRTLELLSAEAVEVALVSGSGELWEVEEEVLSQEDELLVSSLLEAKSPAHHIQRALSPAEVEAELSVWELDEESEEVLLLEAE